MSKSKKTEAERFRKKIEVDEDGCWIWTGSRRGNYGSFRVDVNTVQASHRYAYERANGRKLKKGEVVLHLCDKPLCVRPECLKAGTASENMQDAVRKGRNYTRSRDEQSPVKERDLPSILEFMKRHEKSEGATQFLVNFFGVSYTSIYRALKVAAEEEGKRRNEST